MSRSFLGGRLRAALRADSERPARAVPRTAISRRSFLNGSAALAAASLAPWPAEARAPSRVAVIGGGLAGLAAALRLSEAGVDATVFEARNRVGGRVLSRPAPFAPDVALDLGGAFVNSDHADLLALVERFGLGLYERSHAFAPGLPAEAFLFEGRRIGDPDLAAALLPLAEAVAADAARLDADWDAHAPGIDGRSVADYLDAHLDGPAWARRLVENAIRTEYGVEPHESSALELVWLAPTVEGERVRLLGSSDEAFEIEGGSGRLPEAMAAALGERVQLGAPVSAVIDDGRAVRVMAGGVRRFDAAVIAAPLPALRRIEIHGAIPDGFRAMVAEGRLGRNEKLIAGFTGRPWREAGLFAHGAWTDAGFSQVWDATLQAAGPVSALCFFHGGDEATGLDRDAAAAAARAVASLEVRAPGVTDRLTGGALRTDWLDDPLTGGGYTSFAPGAYTRFAEHLWVEGETPDAHAGPVFGRLAFAGEHLSDAFYGYMNGAAETGRLAAETLIARGFRQAGAGSAEAPG